MKFTLKAATTVFPMVVLLILILSQPAMSLTKDELAKVLKANPELILNLLREHDDQVFQIVVKGQESMLRKQKEASFRRELENPLKPVIDTTRISRGKADAPITIVAYSDFECPFCGRGAKNIESLMSKYPDKFRLFIKHFPLESHKNAIPAAKVFEALADRDKDKAWLFYEKAYAAGKDGLAEGDKSIKDMLTSLGVDADAVMKEAESEKILKRLAEDYREAIGFGINGIPVYLLNGVSVHGAVPVEELERVVGLMEKEAAKKK